MLNVDDSHLSVAKVADVIESVAKGNNIKQNSQSVDCREIKEA